MADSNGASRRVEITCSSCGAKNRIDPSRAAWEAHSVRCGSCSAGLLRGPEEPLHDLDPKQFVHPLDQKALSALKKVPGIDTLLKAVMKEFGDLRWRILHMQSHIKVTPDNVGSLWTIYQSAARRLSVEKVPDLYLYQHPIPNAYTAGVDEPIIAVSSGLVEMMDEDELRGVMGHELTHWICEHSLYRTAAWLIAQLGVSVLGRALGIGNALIMPLQLALMEWSRASELTADRGELLVVGNLRTAIRVSMKLAGGSQKVFAEMSETAFLEQADRLEEEQDSNMLARLMTAWMGANTTHPYAVWRARHAKDFAHSQQYFEILAGKYARRLEART